MRSAALTDYACVASTSARPHRDQAEPLSPACDAKAAHLFRTPFALVRRNPASSRTPWLSVKRTIADPQKPAADAWGSRGRRFKSCQPDRRTASDLRKRRSEAVLVLKFANRGLYFKSRVNRSLTCRFAKPRVQVQSMCRKSWTFIGRKRFRPSALAATGAHPRPCVSLARAIDDPGEGGVAVPAISVESAWFPSAAPRDPR